MYIVRMSLFCITALLVNGAYATDFTGSAGAMARTAELTVPSAQAWTSGSAVRSEAPGSLRQPAARSTEDDGQWLRTASDGKTAIANREPRPASSPRWVF